MKWLIDIFEEFWEQKGTTVVRRAVLALICVPILFYVVLTVKQAKLPEVTPKDRLYFSIGGGVLAMVVTVALELLSPFWNKGCLGKLLACFIVVISLALIFGLIGRFMGKHGAR